MVDTGPLPQRRHLVIAFDIAHQSSATTVRDVLTIAAMWQPMVQHTISLPLADKNDKHNAGPVSPRVCVCRYGPWRLHLQSHDLEHSDWLCLAGSYPAR